MPVAQDAARQPVEQQVDDDPGQRQQEQGREEARDLRMQIAEAGSREPVNVIDGNYLRAADVCPWWNANVPARKTG